MAKGKEEAVIFQKLRLDYFIQILNVIDISMFFFISGFTSLLLKQQQHQFYNITQNVYAYLQY